MNRSAHGALLERRAHLLSRSAQLRGVFAQAAAGLAQPAAMADQVRDWTRRLRSRPQWLLLPAAAVAVLRPRKAFAWSLRLWGAWRLWRQVMAARQR